MHEASCWCTVDEKLEGYKGWGWHKSCDVGRKQGDEK